MSHEQINDLRLAAYCENIAEEIFRDAPDFITGLDWSRERARNSEYVIDPDKSHALCKNCSTYSGHEFLADSYGSQDLPNYDRLASIIAYGEIQSRIETAFCAREWAAETEAMNNFSMHA